MGTSSSRSKDYGSASQTYDKHKITSKLDDDRRKSSLLCGGEDLSQYTAALEVAIDFQAQSEIAQINTVQTRKEAHSQTEEDAGIALEILTTSRKSKLANEIYYVLQKFRLKLSNRDLESHSIIEARSQKEEDPDTVHTRKEARSQKEEDAGNKKSSSFFISEIRDLLFVRYSQGEEDALCFFHTLTVDSRQFLPREWRVLLNYHGLVRNILCLNNEARNVFGWKVQLIAWICICWQWQGNMNILIEKWNSVRKTSDSHGDSLLMLVDYFIENNLCDMSEMTKAISKEHHDKRQRASVKLVEPESNVAKIIDIAESSNRESRELKGVQGQKSKVINDDESKERLSLKEFENVMKGQLETFEKRLDELKKEMKEMIEQATKYNGLDLIAVPGISGSRDIN
ncbi:hypothetical protein SUGI_0708370 [Cryptomeria japonica]|nr:hypothetical protein SUGI_0708370 [Cryptomeria japonica]